MAQTNTEHSAFDHEANIPRERYFNDEYFKRKQFDSLVSQILAVYKLKPVSVLEIGLGNGFVSSFLKAAGIQVTTFDINEELKPDVVGNLVEIDTYFEPNSFDVILCAEVLEHIPFEFFEVILAKFKTISKKHVLITLPRRHRILLDLRTNLKIPFVKPISINIFKRIPDQNNWDGHQWEIDYSPAFSLKIITKAMANHFVVKENYVDEIVRHHQFFILANNK